MKKLLIGILLITSLAANAQLGIELGTKRTELGKTALTFGISYLQSLDSIFGGQELFVAGKNSFFVVTPELDVVSGTEDAFSSIIVKASGLWNVFKTHTVAGLEAPDYNKTFHSFPISLGAESNSQFNNINGILEVGWIPFYQSYARNTPEFIKRSRFGIFMQAGYKFISDSSGVGGQENESAEPEKKGIARARGFFSMDTDAFLTVGALKIGLVGTAEGWLDLANSEQYYRLDGRMRIYLTPDQYFDLIWQRGASAPLFNQAEQIGVGLTFKL